MDALRCGFRAACVAADALAADEQLPTKRLDYFKGNSGDRLRATQSSASAAMQQLLRGLEGLQHSKDWWVCLCCLVCSSSLTDGNRWLLRNIVPLHRRLHAMLFYQRLAELTRCVAAFFAGPCWRLLTRAAAALMAGTDTGTTPAGCCGAPV